MQNTEFYVAVAEPFELPYSGAQGNSAFELPYSGEFYIVTQTH